MSNIYLRLPQYVCDFWHHVTETGREEALVLPEHYSPIMVQMKELLSFMPPDDARRTMACYSERDWRDICQGRRPGYKDQVMKRKETGWPNIEEVYAIEGLKMSDRYQNSDYVAIRMPKTVVSDGKIKVTTPSYSLTHAGASVVAMQFYSMFVVTFMRFLQMNEIVKAQMGIARRDRNEVLERFFNEYDIHISTSNKEKESLRRQVNRWIKDCYALPIDQVTTSSAHYLKHLTEEDKNRIMPEIREFTAEDLEEGDEKS